MSANLVCNFKSNLVFAHQADRVCLPILLGFLDQLVKSCSLWRRKLKLDVLRGASLYHRDVALDDPVSVVGLDARNRVRTLRHNRGDNNLVAILVDHVFVVLNLYILRIAEI